MEPSHSSSPKNQFYNLPSNNAEFWKLIEEKLSFPIPDLKTLTEIINSFTSIIFPHVSLYEKWDSITTALSEISSKYPNFKFFDEILPKIQKACLEMPDLFKETQQKINILPQRENSELKLTGKQIRCLLCHAFFNTLNSFLAQNPNHDPKQSRFGNITFYQLYGRPHQESIERLKCLFYYFMTVFTEEPKEEVIFLRRVLNEFPDWKNDETLITREVNVSDLTKIEDSDAFLHVDFANKNLQIHNNIPSCTQEEVLFSIRPALYITLLISETLKKNEAIFMLGCKRYCNYTGYLHTFKFAGPYEGINDEKKTSGLIAIDSVVNWGNLQFEPKYVDRDLNKAFLGFCGIEKVIEEYVKGKEISLDLKKISTGNWGCGAFGGDYVLKFVQQIMVANKIDRNLDYSTFGDKEKCMILREMDKKIKEKKLRIKDLYEILMDFVKELKKCENLEDYLRTRLKN